MRVSILRIVLLLACSWYTAISVEFSGFYRPVPGKGVNGSGSEDFAAAWLISKERMMASEEKIKETWSMAAVTFAVVRNPCKNCLTVLTRDYFDYMVEHLSSTSNRIPFGDKRVYNITGERLKHTAKRLKKMGNKSNLDSRMLLTLAVLIYSPIAFSMTTTPEQAAIRMSYFEATFYSVYRSFKNIDIFVANQVDADTVIAMNLPYRKLTIVPTPLDKGRTTGLMRLSLQMIIKAIHDNNPVWSWLKYLYFTEGDQVLHLRNARYIYDLIDSSEGSIAVVPHRMNTFPLKTTFPASLQHLWDHPNHGQNHIPSNIEIIVENLNRITGSCCDAGRNVYEPCGQHWWYSCPTWGLGNFTQWFRIGKTGLTFLPSTEHKGVCSYSEEKRLCEMPVGCTERIPAKDYRLISDLHNGVVTRTTDKEYDICGQIPTVNYIVNYTAQMEREQEALKLIHTDGEVQLK